MASVDCPFLASVHCVFSMEHFSCDVYTHCRCVYTVCVRTLYMCILLVYTHCLYVYCLWYILYMCIVYTACDTHCIWYVLSRCVGIQLQQAPPGKLTLWTSPAVSTKEDKWYPIQQRKCSERKIEIRQIFTLFQNNAKKEFYVFWPKTGGWPKQTKKKE